MTRENAIKNVLALRQEFRDRFIKPGVEGAWADTDITEAIIARYVQAAVILMVDNLTVYPSEP